MNCMKCGREVVLGQVFCKECLADMANYPVQPGTPVILPSQSASSQPRRVAPRKTKKPEEQISSLRKAVRFLSIALVIVSLAFGITTSILVNQLNHGEDDPEHGQNYSTEAAESIG